MEEFGIIIGNNPIFVMTCNSEKGIDYGLGAFSDRRIGIKFDCRFCRVFLLL